jgi:hypothetical protein
MIGFNRLGSYGRLGNQMFQYAALRGIAAFHGYEFCIPGSNRRNEAKSYELLEAFALPNLKHKALIMPDSYEEREFNFSQKYVCECPDNTSLLGYFQTEKYFLHIACSIREDFAFNFETLNTCRKMFAFDQSISLHIRRGDYVNSVNHPLCPMEYYEKALSKLDPRLPVIIFSDDIKWCQEQGIFRSDRFVFSESNSPITDMCLMTMCSCHIIANSSYSWWGAWLSGSDRVIAPARWFGDSGYTASLNTEDIVPSRWSTIAI